MFNKRLNSTRQYYNFIDDTFMIVKQNQTTCNSSLITPRPYHSEISITKCVLSS